MDPEHIDIDTAARLGAELRGAVEDGWRYRARLNKVRAIMDKLVSAGKFDFVAGAFGVVPGAGQAVYNLTSGAMAEVNGPNTEQFLDRLG